MTWSTYIIGVFLSLILLPLILFIFYSFKKSKYELPKEFKNIDSSLPKLGPGISKNPALDKMDKMLQEKGITKGELFFEAPIEMITGKSYRIICEIAKTANLIIKENSSNNVFDIPVTDLMSCKLHGEKFIISQINNETQKILTQQITFWQWNVIPQKGGLQNLILLASIYIKEKDSNYLKDIPVFERPVLVKINPKYHVSQFFIKHWQWLAGTIVGSGILFEIIKLKIK